MSLGQKKTQQVEMIVLLSRGKTILPPTHDNEVTKVSVWNRVDVTTIAMQCHGIEKKKCRLPQHNLVRSCLLAQFKTKPDQRTTATRLVITFSTTSARRLPQE